MKNEIDIRFQIFSQKKLEPRQTVFHRVGLFHGVPGDKNGISRKETNRP